MEEQTVSRRAGRLTGGGLVWLDTLLPLWRRYLSTNSSAWGSVYRWSEVFSLVYSSAQGPSTKHHKKLYSVDNTKAGIQKAYRGCITNNDPVAKQCMKNMAK